MLFTLLIHIFVLFPDQFKIYKLISVVFTVKGCCQEPPRTLSFAKRGSQNRHAVVIFKVFNQDRAWCYTNTNEGYYSFLSLQTTFFPHPVFLGDFCKPYILALLQSERKSAGGQDVASLAKKSVGLLICWVRRRKRKIWFNTKITGKKVSMKSPSTRVLISMKSLLPCVLPGMRLTDGSWIL